MERGRAEIARSLVTPPSHEAAAARVLPEEPRRLFEQRFGHDFSRVRVYADDPPADRAAAAAGARAYTVGSDIVFGAGQYRPGTEAGRRLLAHELVHVVQQEGAATVARERLRPNAACEREADAAASAPAPVSIRCHPAAMFIGCQSIPGASGREAWWGRDRHGRPRRTPPGYGLDSRWYDPNVPVLQPDVPVTGPLRPGTRGTHDGLRWAYYGEEIRVQQRIPRSEVIPTDRPRRFYLRHRETFRDIDGAPVEHANGVVYVRHEQSTAQSVVVGDLGWLFNNPGEIRGGNPPSRGERARREHPGALGVGELNRVVFPTEEAGRQAIPGVVRRSRPGESFVSRMCRYDLNREDESCQPWEIDPTMPVPPGQTRRDAAYVPYARAILAGAGRRMTERASALTPEMIEDMAGFVARNESPGRGRVYRRTDANLPQWVQDIFNASPSPSPASPPDAGPADAAAPDATSAP